jgi:sugar-specific transcriptional regulator TrmB
MSEIHMEIVDMLEQGDRPIKIATLLNVPVSMVYDVLEQLEQEEMYNPFDTVNS